MNIVEPAVQLLAHTAIVPDAIEQRLEIQEGSTDAETLTVFAGRSCYESWSRPNEKTREDKDYLRRTLFEQVHTSIMEHASATFYLTGVSRALLAEITRHRHLSFSVMSQRFVSEEDANIVIPPAIRDAKEINETHYDEELGGEVIGATDNLKVMANLAIATYAGLVEELQEVEGLSRKQIGRAHV